MIDFRNLTLPTVLTVVCVISICVQRSHRAADFANVDSSQIRGGCWQVKDDGDCPEEIVPCGMQSCDEQSNTCPQNEPGYEQDAEAILGAQANNNGGEGFDSRLPFDWVCGWFVYCVYDCDFSTVLNSSICPPDLDNGVEDIRPVLGPGGEEVTCDVVAQARPRPRPAYTSRRIAFLLRANGHS